MVLSGQKFDLIMVSGRWALGRFIGHWGGWPKEIILARRLVRKA